jgi:heme-degrading monooxygenase HmoA
MSKDALVKGQSMYHLAQFNLTRMLAPLDDPVMAEFVARLDEINAIADQSQGFIWRLQTEKGNATTIQAYEDDRVIVNMSVWRSLKDLANYVYASEHGQVMKRRQHWFEKFDGPKIAIWWIPREHIPTVEEGKQRLEHLRLHGETPYAFSFKKAFPAPNAVSEDTTGKILTESLD